MVHLWRIGADTSQYTAEDMSGQGAKNSGGRWNRSGLPVVYAASSISLAALETLVHFESDALPLNRYLVRLDVPQHLWGARRLATTSSLAVGWDACPEGMVSLDYGDAWLKSGSSALMEVPSVIVPEESNVLVNPSHEDVKEIRVTKIRLWRYDPRIR